MIVAAAVLTLAQGLAEMRRLSEAEKPDEALAVADRLLAPGRLARWSETPGWKRTAVEAATPLLEAIGLSDLTSSDRAAIQFARGVVLANAKKVADSDAAFEQARALAGPGELRFEATYDLGWNALAEGEAQRAKLPELGGQPPQQAGPQPGPQPGEPDPLQLARAAYTKALARFVECLKLDARDADTRANAELARKRLHELDEIQKKREEEKKKQEEQQKKDQEKKDQDKKDQQKPDDQQKKDSSADKDKDKDKKNPDEQPKEDKPKDEKKDGEESDKSKQEKKEAQPQQAQEQQLTKEEIMRILDTLKDREEEGKKLLEQLRRAHRAKVKKDW